MVCGSYSHRTRAMAWGGSLSGSHPGKACARPIVIILSLLQNYKNAVTPAEAGVQKPLTSLDSCFRRNDRKKHV